MERRRSSAKRRGAVAWAALALAALPACTNPSVSEEVRRLRLSRWYGKYRPHVRESGMIFGNDAIWLGTVEEDIPPPPLAGPLRWLNMCPARAVLAFHPTRRRAISILYDFHPFAAGPTPKQGERWAIYAHQNPQGLWRVRAAVPLERLGAEPSRNAAAERRELRSLKALSAQEAAERQGAAARALGVEKAISVPLAGDVALKLALIPASDFVMGIPSEDDYFSHGQSPRHVVSIARPFYMGVHEVTQRQYQTVVGRNPSRYDGPQRPVEGVTWEDANEFCRQLAARTGRTVRLPTEAEWEYACRAGATTCYHWGEEFDGTKMNFADKNAPVQYPLEDVDDGHARAAPVGQYPPNAWGLYDMHGNVREWCSDWYDPDWYVFSPRRDPTGPDTGRIRVVRGGGWQDAGCFTTASFRCFDVLPVTSEQPEAVGFRVVVEMGQARGEKPTREGAASLTKTSGAATLLPRLDVAREGMRGEARP